MIHGEILNTDNDIPVIKHPFVRHELANLRDKNINRSDGI